MLSRETHGGANVRREEGNNPDRQLRSQSMVKWETMWEGPDSQDVGLEAPSFKESVIAHWSSRPARKMYGAKPCTEAAAATLMRCWVGSVL